MVLTPLFGALLFRHRVGPAAWAAAGVSALGLFLLSGAGGDATLRGDGLVFLCACAFAVHILVTERAVARYDVGALVAVQLGVCGLVLPRRRGGRRATSRRRAAPPSGARCWSRRWSRARSASSSRATRSSTISPARTALILAAEPAFAGCSATCWQDDGCRPLDGPARR